ncbi:MAG TPA: dTDP-4-dehydrorhamnose reductase [Myxococcota bacterium]|jgi:dTDP-4-dehydrorhamnose reductase
MQSRWVVAGCLGQLGHALTGELSAQGRAVVAAGDLPELDIADRAGLLRFLEGLAAPLVVVNAAAFTHVDRCEREPAAAWRANVEGPERLAEICQERGYRLVHVSTDYVFAGDGTRPYREDDPPAPRSEYGRSKLEGERRVLARCPSALVVRTSWVFGRGRNFIAAILAQARERRLTGAATPLRVVDDQRGRPTYAVDLAAGIRTLVEADARGLYHVANLGEATWWEVARASLDEAGFGDLGIDRIQTQDLSLPAPRPKYSVLDSSKAEALGVRPRGWRDALRAYLRSSDSPLAPEGKTA